MLEYRSYQRASSARFGLFFYDGGAWIAGLYGTAARMMSVCREMRHQGYRVRVRPYTGGLG